MFEVLTAEEATELCTILRHGYKSSVNICRDHASVFLTDLDDNGQHARDKFLNAQAGIRQENTGLRTQIIQEVGL